MSLVENRTPILEVKNLKQYFKSGFGKKRVVTKAVDGISFEIYQGEVFGLVGESGCGKTTTGRSIIKLHEITDGEIYYKGRRISAGTLSYYEELRNLRKQYLNKKISKKEYKEKRLAIKKEIKNAKIDTEGTKLNTQEIIQLKEELKKLKSQLFKFKINFSEYRSQKKEILQKIEEIKKSTKTNQELMNEIQMIFQDPIGSLNPRMTVREIIAEGLRIQGVKDEKIIDDKVYTMLNLVGLLPDHAGRYPHEFSGGQRQRIGIARALVMEPELIIADEPISALDVSIQAQVLNLLKDLKEKFNLTILFIAHDLSVVKYFSDRIAVMYYGKIVELASSDELFNNPLHPYTQSLISAIPLPDPEFEKIRKRIIYDPSIHDYSVDKPSLREIKPGHWIYANEEEFEKYKKQLKK